MPTVPVAAPLPRNIRLDRKTVESMLEIYCHHEHYAATEALCPECAKLMSYASYRLEKCPFGPEKTTCRECPIHCYRPAERAEMKRVMIFSGPRMMLRHPWLAIRHLWLDKKGAPPWPPYARRAR